MDIGKLGTLLFTWFRGELVGTDPFGNRYYRSTKIHLHGRERRWVLYSGSKEASKVPAEWHAWLHHTTAAPLSEHAAAPKDWQKSHIPNLTGTRGAYYPRGHVQAGGRRARATGDYDAWQPR